MVNEGVADCYNCGAPIDITSHEPFARITCPKCGASLRVKVEFGAYTLQRRLTVGGMSVVFIAADRTLGREVAVKILNQDYSKDERRMAAFEEEAKLTASISHPHVVRVFTTGRAFGRFFIAMEYVTGGHLEDKIHRSKGLPELQALQWAREVAEGLRAAHHAGLIHRDVKPGNILIDANGRAKIVDFGLALVTQGGKAKASEIWATPYYVPPEAIEGRTEDFRSDIYAFGATFYHALAGRPPCNEESMDTKRLRAAKQSLKPLAETAPYLTPETCRCIDRCMRFNAGERFQSYRELLAAIERAITVARRRPADEVARVRSSTRKSPRRRPWTAIPWIGLGLLTAGVLLWWILGQRSEGPSASRSDTGDPVVSAPVEDAEKPVARPRTAGLHRSLSAMGWQALDDGNEREALAVFAGIRGGREFPMSARMEAALHGVLAAYVIGDRQGIVTEIDAAEELLSGWEDMNGGVRRQLKDLLEALRDWPPVDVRVLRAGSEWDSVARLLAALKDWQNGMFERAASALRELGDDSGSDRWRPLIADHLADLRLLREVEPESFRISPDEAGRCVAEIDRCMEQLRTSGRAPFTLKCWRQMLDAGVFGQARFQLPGKFEELVAEGRFREAEELLRGWQPGAAGMSQGRRGWMRLVEAAQLWVDDLIRGNEVWGKYGLQVRDRQGTVRGSLLSVERTGPRVAAPDGEVQGLTWSEVDMGQWIDWHGRLVQLKSATGLRRWRILERQAAMERLVGDPVIAEQRVRAWLEESAWFAAVWPILEND